MVTNSRARGSLAAVRALAAAGWTVGAGTPDGAGMVTASSSCHRSHIVPRPRGSGEGFVEGVRAAAVDGGYDVVFGGGDDWMAALATYRSSIPSCVAHPSAPVVMAGLDKVDLARRAAAAGLPAPRTVAASDAALAAWDGPVVVKCRAHWRPGRAHPHRVEARRFPSADAAAERVCLLQDGGFEPVLQQCVDGSLGALVGLFVDGRLVGRVQQQTSGLWPTPSGVSCRAETVRVDEGLAAAADALLRGLGWSGLVELQFLWDADGVPHLIDLNGRFYGSMALANAAGANLPDAWGRCVLGLALPELRDAPPGVRCLWTAGDVRRATVERRGGLLADLASTLRRLPGATTSVWDRRDPGPTWELVAERLHPRRREEDSVGLARATASSSWREERC